MDQETRMISRWTGASKRFYSRYSSALLLSGLGYLVIQFLLLARIQDAFFVGLLFGASSILLFAFRWVQSFFTEHLQAVYGGLELAGEADEETFARQIRQIFANPMVQIGGIGYGFLVSSAPFLLGTWSANPIVNVAMGVFLFVVNYLTGLAIVSLVFCLQFAYFVAQRVTICLYDRTNPGVHFVVILSKRISLVAALYVAFSIGAILVSVLPLNTLTLGYSFYAVAIILFVFFAPLIPIRNKLQRQKERILSDIARHLEQELEVQLRGMHAGEKIDLKKYNSMLGLRRKIGSLHTFPMPTKVVWNSIYVISITFLPVILQTVMQWLLRW